MPRMCQAKITTKNVLSRDRTITYPKCSRRMNFHSYLGFRKIWGSGRFGVQEFRIFGVQEEACQFLRKEIAVYYQ